MVFVPLEVDDSDSRRVPTVSLSLVCANIAVFVLFQGLGGVGFTASLWLDPKEIASGVDNVPITPVPLWMTLVTYMFLHGDLWHLIGNMLFLWIFGPVLENVMGHRKYLAFYLFAGITAGLCYVWVSLGHPMLGASGAVAGVLGGLMALQPSRKVTGLLFGVFPVVIPCFLAIGVYEIISDIVPFLLGSRPGVAISAHLGGFAFGFLAARFFQTPVGPRKKDLRDSRQNAATR